MARAKRHYLPGQVWHITHRCHKREFLLKFNKDRKRWIHWLFEAKRRYGLTILNYVVTSNHIHLLVVDDKDRTTIPKSIQLTAGRLAQEYKQRKNRKGAYWEDRYHATAIETGSHLMRCLVYIDLNMVRAGVVSHPAEWEFGGYNEIQYPRRKSILINYDKLAFLSGCDSYASFQHLHRNLINTVLETDKIRKEVFWSQSIAVGKEQFVNLIKKKLGSKALGRKKYPLDDGYFLREETVSYIPDYDIKNSEIGLKNEYEWNISPDI
jgi:putative transposase